jgi:cytochrome P450
MSAEENKVLVRRAVDEAWNQQNMVAAATDQAGLPVPLVASATPGPAGPKPRFLLGHLLELSRDPLGLVTRCAREYGDVVPLRFGRRSVILLSHPEDADEVLVSRQRSFAKGYFYRILGLLLGNGLITSEGDFWLRQRRLAQPAFHRERISAYAETMVRYTRELMASWRPGQVREVHADMNGLTLRVVCKTLFDADVAGDASDVGDAVMVALRELNNQITGPELLLPRAIPTLSRYRLRRAVRRLDSFVYRIIAERRRSGVDRGDLLSALLHAQDDDGSGMTDRQLRDEAMTIIVAGHETTALALTWAWYLLAQHPAAEARLHAELDSVLGDRAPTMADVAHLPFTNAVVTESLRLYPPIWSVGREATEDTHVGGYPVPKGMQVLLNMWAIQRDPRYYADPEAFRPERWLDERAPKTPRFVYFPFGGGPRQCIGRSFALLEAALVLATIARRYGLVLEPGQTVTPLPAGTLRPRNGLRMRLEARVPPTSGRPRHPEPGEPADREPPVAGPSDRSLRAAGVSASACPVHAS